MTMGDTFGPGERQPQFRGVSGLLLFLCISLIVFLPIQAALFVWVFVRTPEISRTLPVLILIVALDAFGVIAGALLYRERPLGVLLAKIFFGLRIALGLPVVLQDQLVGSLVMIGPVAWLTYLFRWERVRNTYSEDKSKEAAEVFR